MLLDREVVIRTSLTSVVMHVTTGPSGGLTACVCVCLTSDTITSKPSPPLLRSITEQLSLNVASSGQIKKIETRRICEFRKHITVEQQAHFLTSINAAAWSPSVHITDLIYAVVTSNSVKF
jgi:vesicle coat complex subunit